jgi:hypothetical protein
MKSFVVAANRLFASWYKALGFFALAAILFGLVSYFVVHAFYLVSDSWLAPVILSPSHERVIEANAQLASHQYQRDKLAAERAQLATELAQAERVAAVNAGYLTRFEAALDAELAGVRKERGTYATLRAQARRTGRLLNERGRELQAVKGEVAAKERELRLVTREAAAAEDLSMARIEQTAATMAQAEAELALRNEQLGRREESLRAAKAGGGGVAVTYDVLAMERERDHWRLEAQYARERAEDLKRQLGLLDDAVARYDALLAQIRQSPYLRAFTERVTIAFVPYDNLSEVRAGEPLFACALGLVWCQEVGRVVAALDGEVSARHPQSNEPLRGQMVELALDDREAAEHLVLFAGNKPLLVL